MKSSYAKALSLCVMTILITTTTFLYPSPEDEYVPLYAGTQLAFYSTNIPPGHISVQPYFSYIHQYGAYNSHWTEKSQKSIDGVACLFALETGITNWLDISLYLNGVYRRFGNENSWVLGDTTIFLGLQLLRDKKHDWTPDLRLLLAETFPTGKYDRLNPHKGGSDVFGTGSYVTTALLVLAKTFYTLPKHPYNLNLNLFYLYPSHALVHGSSLYGGTRSTRGKALPDSGFITNLAIEYSFNRFWVLGMDIRYVHQNKTTFKIHKNPQKFTIPSSEQFSIAPCLEYSWSENFSTTFGPWFTIAGHNSPAFFGGTANIYCYF